MKHNLEHSNNRKTFYVIGLNYKKVNAELRGLFSVNELTQTAMLLEARNTGITALSILSTCNRTELYGFSENPFQLIKLLCKHTKGSLEDFEKVAYVYKEQETVSHLFHVGAGLDSQILGDFEIISQLRRSFRKSKSEGMLNAYMERLINAVIQASKRIKSETALSSGATSISYAAAKYIHKKVENITHKNLLLYGTGEIGRNTVENLIKHITPESIGLINRTRINAEAIAGKFNLKIKEYENLAVEITKSDVLVVATGASNPTITKDHLKHINAPLLIIDLSIPKNVAIEVEELKDVKLIHLDELVKITKETQNYRKEEIPEALQIIEEIKKDFFEWVDSQRFVPTIRALKEKLNTIKNNEIDNQSKKLKDFNEEHAEVLGNRLVHKITTQFAKNMRNEHIELNDCIDLITEVFELEFKNTEV